jgi:tetratricopeptide (TPR) repeat protein
MTQKAEKEIRRAVELKPDFPEAWSNLGGVFLSRWDFAGCIDANRKALELDPELVQAHFNMGLGCMYKGDTKEMLACFRRVLDIDPDNAGGHYHMAVGLHAEGHIEEAHRALAIAVARGYTPQPEFLKALESHGGADGPVHTMEFDPGSKESTK